MSNVDDPPEEMGHFRWKKKEKKRTMDDSLIWQCFFKKALLTCLTVHKHLSLLASNYELEKMQEWFENGTILLS